jgi:elongation factor G
MHRFTSFRPVTSTAVVALEAKRCASKAFTDNIGHVRNIGISAHIDSGKTTLTERILFYTGKIKAMHEVKGSSDVGATMDSMELEKERGITIRSAATFCKWKDTQINLIDTPGHVDFTIEVERSLRVLDGAVLLMCGVGGVQSQTLTVDRQMKRYSVPRICFINKMDRDNANPQRALAQAIERLAINAAFLQINIGTSQDFEGVVDVIEQKALYFEGKHGEKFREEPVPEYLAEDLVAARKELLARLAESDAAMEEHFLMETEPTPAEFHSAIRRATIANKFVPVMVGSAYKNKGVQLLLDNIERYLPNPTERSNSGFEMVKAEDEEGNAFWEKKGTVTLATDDEKPLIAMIFKLETTAAVGMSNYVRVYQGKLRKSDSLVNIRTGKAVNPSKLVRMHADGTEAVDVVNCGEICAILGDIGASSGDTIAKVIGKEEKRIACEDMYIPPVVLSIAVSNSKDKRAESAGYDQLVKFMREDPTFKVSKNSETDEIHLEGMGELHLDIYVERLKREFGIVMEKGKPTVNYREIIQKAVEFDYVHKRQSGGAGQWAHIKGIIEPLTINMSTERGTKNRIYLKASNNDIREQLQKSVGKAFNNTIFKKGLIMNAPVWGTKVTLKGGAMHEVDSNDVAFRAASTLMWESMLPKLEPTIVEPWMNVEMTAPSQYMSDIMSEFTRREGTVVDSATAGNDCVIRGETPLDAMFGFIIDLRKMTKGQGDFSMDFSEYRPMPAFKAQNVAEERNAHLKRKQPFSLTE